jgi:uncharacterized membrane protein
MKLQEYSVLFVAITGVLALTVASPALSRLLVFPRTEFFTGFWILGPNHKAYDYPFNITRDHNYSVFLAMANYLGYCAYYKVEVKFRNQTQSAPDSFNHTSSSLSALYNITVFVPDRESWELPLVFRFDYEYNTTLLKVDRLTLNDVTLGMENYTITWDSKKHGFFANLFLELWVYNQATGDFQYHERFTSLWLNMTTM